MSTATQPTLAAIILYGSSPLLDGVELTLRQNTCAEPCHPLIRHADTSTPISLHNVPTGTIIYDQNSVELTAVYHLLSNYPDWQFVGLTASSEELLIINSEKRNGRSLTDVMEVFNRQQERAV